MPLLLWMPMIVFYGMWDIAERSTQDFMEAGTPRAQ
jgi:hypothetical protein